jgi:hypothetical protein
MDKFTLSATLINAVLQYLDTRPHGEVRRLIDAITQDVQQQQPPAEPPAEETWTTSNYLTQLLALLVS